MKRFGAFLVLIAVVACGKRGDPRPPVPIIPKATSDLVVAQRGSKIVLTWSYPSLTTTGASLRTVRRVVVYRATEPLPVSEPGRDPNSIVPADVDPSIPRPVSQFSRVPPLSPAQFAKLRDRLDSIESANLPEATAGAKLMYEDAPPLQTSDGRPVRYTYAVTTETATTRGAASNLVRIVPVTVPQPPADVKATGEPRGVVLTWSAAPGGTPASVAGYNIYRHPASQEIEALATPVNPAPVSATTFTDVPPYGKYAYFVRTVASAGPPLIESEPSTAVTAEFKDLLPPPQPTNVAALVETKTVRVVWDAVSAPDLAGYRVYRAEGVGWPPQPGAPPILFTPQLLKTTNFTDNAVDPGIGYYYLVTSVDTSGNESARTKTDWIFVPKTP